MQEWQLETMGGWDTASGSREKIVASYLAAFPGDTEEHLIQWFDALWEDGYRGPVMETVLGRNEEPEE